MNIVFKVGFATNLHTFVVIILNFGYVTVSKFIKLIVNILLQIVNSTVSNLFLHRLALEVFLLSRQKHWSQWHP